MKRLLKPLMLTLAIGLAISSAPAVAVAAPADVSLKQLEARVAALPPLPAPKLQNLKRAAEANDWSRIARSAIDPDAYQCAPTALSEWTSAQVSGTDPLVLFLMSLTGMLELPTYDALLFGAQSRSNRFGVNGEYSQLLTSQYKDLGKFWDAYPAGMQLVPMKGADTFRDRGRLIDLLMIVHGLDEAGAGEYADIYALIFQMAPELRNGDHPIFTLNAFAFDGDSSLGISPRIVMGDGIMQGMDGIGLGGVGPRAILAHEFGHTVQMAQNLFESDLTGPEATRRTELMADGFGVYYLTHARGEALNSKRLLPSMQTFYEVGDCGFDSPGHHGTPNQRLRAGQWAADLANGARPQGRIQPSLGLAARFDAVLPTLVVPDAP